MATNPFLQDPFTKLATDLEAEAAQPLPGQQAAAPAPVQAEVPQAKAATTTEPAAPAAEAPVEGRRPTRTKSMLPPPQLQPTFEAAAKQYNVPVNVLMALGQQESGYNPSIIGQPTKWGRAKGMMQYLDSTAAGLGINPLNPDEAIGAAAKQLRERLDKGYSMEDAVKEHFAGPDRKLWGAKTAVYGREVMQKTAQIGELLGAGSGDQELQGKLDAEEPGRYKVLPAGYAQNNQSAAMPRDTYLRTFRQNNPNASPAAIEQAMAQYDKTKARAPAMQGITVPDSPEAFFDQRLNQRLQGPANGIVPGLPGVLTRQQQDDADFLNIGTKTNAPTGVAANAADVGKGLKVGLNTAAQDVRELVGRIPVIGQPIVRGGDAVDQFFNGKDSGKLLADDSKAMTESMTPEMQSALKKKWYDSESGKMGPAWSDWRSYTGGLVQSLPEQALTMGPAMKLAKMAYTAKIAAGATAEVAALSAARTAQVAGSLAEGALGGAQSAREVREDVMALPPEVLAQSDAFKALVASGLNPADAQKALAEDVATRAFVTSGLVTGAFGGMGDRAIAKLFAQKIGKSAVTGALKGFGKGAIAEGLFEELPQSMGQRLSQNEAMQKADPTRALSDDVINQGLGGAVLGGLQGGGMGAVAGARGIRQSPEQEIATEINRQVNEVNFVGGDAAARAAMDPNNEAVDPATTRKPAPPSKTPAAPADSAPPAPSSGKPLGDALNNAAEQPQRVVVDTPGGPVAGTLQAYQEDEQGGFTAQVVDDNGQVVTISDTDGVVITPVAPPVGPLTSAVEDVAAKQSDAPAATPAAPRITVGNEAGWTNQNVQAARDLADRHGLTDTIEKEFSQGKTVAQVRTSMKEQMKFLPPEEHAGFITGVRATLGIPSQADEDGKREFAAWKSAFDARNTPTPTPDTPAPITPAVVGELGTGIADGMYDMLWAKVEKGDTKELGKQSMILQAAKLVRDAGGLKTKDEFRELAQKVTDAVNGKVGEARNQAIRSVIAGFTPVDAPAPTPEPRQPAAQQAVADMSDDELRSRLKYIAGQAKSSGWDKRFMEARREIEREINQRADAQKKEAAAAAAAVVDPTEFTDRADANAAMLRAAERENKVFEVVEAGGKFKIQLVAEVSDAGTADGNGRRGSDRAAGGNESAVGNGSVPAGDAGRRLANVGAADRADEQRDAAGVPAADPAAVADAPLKDAHAGKWFSSQEKADAYVAKKKIGASHEVLKTGKVRFEVKPRAAEPAIPSKSTELESLPVPDLAGKKIDKEWTAFAADSGTLNIDRAAMPQVKAEHRGALVNYLNARGIAHEQAEVAASDLKPTQREFSPEKVARAKSFDGGDRSILISSDNHVLDGHHQWLAKREDGAPVKVIRLDAPIKQLLDEVKDFPSAQVAAGATTPVVAPAEKVPDLAPATPAPAKPAPKKLTGKAAAAERARQLADYFTPGNIVKGYGGYDRVIAYTPGTKEEGMNVRVQAVEKKDGQWVPVKNERERSHSTIPSEREMKTGIVERAPIAEKVPDLAPSAEENEAPPAAVRDTSGKIYETKGEPLPVKGVAPANIGSNGIAYIGKPNSQHFQIAMDHPTSERGAFLDTGFVTPDGQYLSREEALAWVNENEKKVKPGANMDGQLDALDYREQVPEGRRKGKGASAEPDKKAAASKGSRPAAAPAVPSDAPGAPISDFGEKIEGARKDLWATYKTEMKGELPADVKEITLAKHFPEPNYDALIAEGVDVKVLAALKAMRDEIPAKPRVPYKAKRWGEQVMTLRSFANDLLDGTYTADTLLAKMRTADSGALRKFADRIQMYAEVGYPAFRQAKGYNLTSNSYSLFAGKEYKPHIVKFDLTKDGRTVSYFDSRGEAMAALKSLLSAAPAPAASRATKLDMYRLSNGEIVIGKKVAAGKYIDLKGGFKDVRTARDYLRENEAELAKLLEAKKDVRPERRSINTPRVGKDMRLGEDITPEKFGETFKFRGVQFGNYVEQKRRATDLNNAYDALLDMAEITGLPPAAISLDGSLGLAFGARGAGGKNAAAAHYEPGNVVINLTKTNGAGSLGHEWWHALDNYFSRKRGDIEGFVSAKPTVRKKAGEGRTLVDDDSIRPEALEAFNGVVSAIQASGMPKRSSALDARRTKDYWSTIHELTARAFESYLIDKAAEKGGSNDYLANIVSEDAHKAMDEMTGQPEPFPYPTREEAPAINAAFDKLFEVLKTEKTDKGMAVYSVAGDRAGDADRFAAESMAELAANDDMFQYPRAKSRSLEGVISEVDPTLSVAGDVTAADEKAESGADSKTLLRTGNGKDFFLFRKGKDIWIDVSRLKEGDGGNAIYAAVANYAHNAGLKFIGDPAGLSDRALTRRTDAMLSSALKFGTTDHLEPHPRQVEGDSALGVPPLVWRDGDTLGNIQSLIDVSLKSIQHHVPEIKNASFDFATRTFRTSKGLPLTDGVIRSWDGHQRIRAAGAGSGSIKRAIVLESLVRSEGGSRPAILASIIRRAGQFGSLNDTLYSTTGKASGQSLTADSLRTAITNGTLGPVVGSLIDAGLIVLHETPATLPRNVGNQAQDIQAVTTPDGKVHLVASAMSAGNARAVMLHEAFHQGGEKLIGTQQWDALMRRAGQLYRQANQSQGKAKEFFDKARERVYSAYRKGAVEPHMEVEEFAAYAIEEYESAPATVRKWIDDLIGMVKAWALKRFGKQLGALTPAQLSALAKMAVLDVAATRRGEVFGKKGDWFSVAGKTSSEAFKRWFGASKIVGKNGEPLVVYHGSGEDIEAFRTDGDGKRGNGGKYGKGAYFTPMQDMANHYADKAGRNGGDAVVYPVYLSVKNPLSLSDLVDRARWAGQIQAGGLTGAIASIKLRLSTARADGIIIYDGNGDMAEVVVFDPAQVKSAIGNDGTFDPSNKGIRYSVAGDTRADPAPAPSPTPTPGPAPAPADADLTPPEQGRLRKVQAALQNNMNRLRQVQDRIEKLAGAPMRESVDYYGAETNRPGRVAARLEDAERQLTGPLMERLAKSKHTQEQLSELLHAMHAQERNEKIAEFNQDMPDGGSGMTTAEANKVLDKYAAARELHAIADQAREIAKATLDLKLAYGLINDEDHKQLTEVYDNYVPLKGDGEFGPKIKRAMGHDAREEHILENLSRDYNQAVIVGEKNLARQSLLRMVLANPDPDLWTVGVPPRGRRIAGQTFLIKSGGETIASFNTLSQATAFAEGKGGNVEITDTKGERIQEYVRPLQDNEVMVYVKGSPVRIQIKDTQLAAQLRPLDQGKMNPILEFMRNTNRYLSKIYTGYNPAFILRNATRDAMTGTISMLGNNGAAIAAKAWSKYPGAVKALGQWAATGKVPDGKTGAYLTEYRMHGGKVGASWMSDLEASGKKLSTMYEDAYGATNYAKDGRPTKAAIVAGRKIVGGMAHIVEIANQATENGLRLSLYIAMREKGATPGKAAQAAKTVTVDFDRKGTMTGAMGGIYLFFNPAVQGTANALKTLSKGAHKEQAWAALGSLALLGAYLASRGMDDDRDRWLGEGWETRSKNMIWNVGSHQIRVPVSQEYAPAFSLGMALAEAARGESKMKASARILSSFLDAYFPLQGAHIDGSDNPAMDLSLAMTPTMLKPFAQSAANRSSFGGQIVPENSMTKERPDNLKMFRGTKNSLYDKAAQNIASFGELTGAGKYENDITKVSPETLKMLWRTYTGGLGTFVTDTMGATAMTVSDPKQVEATDWPILKDFWRDSGVKPIRGRYYDLTGQARSAITEFEQAKKAGDGEAMEKVFDDPAKAQAVSAGRMIKSVNKAAASIRDGEVDINASTDMTPSEKRAALKDLEKQEEELYRDAIEAFK